MFRLTKIDQITVCFLFVRK